MVQPCEKGRMLSRSTVAICVSISGVGGKRRNLSGGTGFLAIYGIVLSILAFIILALLLEPRLQLQWVKAELCRGKRGSLRSLALHFQP